jgi:hypothetical protein
MSWGIRLLTYTPSRRAQGQPNIQPYIVRITDVQMPQALLPEDAHVHLWVHTVGKLI